MLMRIKKVSIFKALLTLIFTLNMVNVRALYINSYSGGNSTPVILPDCDNYSGEGCGNFSQEFEIKVTLVRYEDGEFHQVDETNTIHFIAGNNRNPDHGSYSPNGNSEGHSLQLYTGKYEFSNSNVAKKYDGNSWVRADYFPDEQDYYTMYLGFDADYCNDFSCYEMNREDFIDYVVNNYRDSLYVDEIGDYVSFLDFFLNKSGYTSEWHATDNPDVLNSIEDQGLTLLVEPVYTIYMTHNGYYYWIKGTIKQLSEVIFNTLYDQKPKDMWFWPANVPGNSFNAYCNFIDYSDYFRKDYNSICSSVDNFAMNYRGLNDVLNGLSYCESKKGTPDYDYCTTFWGDQKKRLTDNSNLREGLKDVYSTIADPNYAYGISAIDLSQIGGGIEDDSPTYVDIENSCELEVKKCDSDWSFESKLTSSTGDIFHCVVPTGVSNIREGLDGVITHYETYDMWCYDDISYSFHDLKDEFNNKILKTNQVALLPNARLKVNRICYTGYGSDVDMIEPLQTDDYSDEFTFEYLGKQYKYKKEGSRYRYNSDGSKNTTLETNVEEINPPYETMTYHRYSTEFYYDYVAEVGTPSDTTTINIFDRSISTSLGNSNSLYAYTGTKEGKIIKIPTSVEKKYENSQSELKVNNIKYGQNSKMYNAFKGGNTDTLYAGWGTSEEINNTIYQSLNTYKLNETNNNCTITTHVVDDRIDIGDKLKDAGVQFRVIALDNPFPARDGSQRMPGENWLATNRNNVYTYITNNRNIQGAGVRMTSYENPNDIYTSKAPLYSITLDPQTMVSIREYNKTHSYGQLDLTCEEGTGRACISNFLRNNIPNLEGKCKESEIQSRYITNKNNGNYDPTSNRDSYMEVYMCLATGGTPETCKASSVRDLNGDGKIDASDASTIKDDFYSCADKTPESGG